MGTGSSKAKSISVENLQVTAHSPVVANVNKLETTTKESRAQGEKNVVTDVVMEVPTDQILLTGKKEQILQRNKTDVFENERNDNSYVRHQIVHDDRGHRGLLFQDESDLDDDIDEVLKIPVAVEHSKNNGGKESKKKQESKKESNGFEELHEIQVGGTTKVSTDTHLPLPETYAQRLQRQQQHRLQKSLLLPDREIMMRQPKEWHQESDGDTDGESHYTVFDAAKFRAANRGGDFRKDVFSLQEKDVKIPRYIQSLGPEFDDFDMTTRDSPTLTKQLPRYDQSELDLMKQLEDEIW